MKFLMISLMLIRSGFVFADAFSQDYRNMREIVFEKIRFSIANDDNPVVLFDLDETLFNSHSRAVKIFHEIANDPWLYKNDPIASNRLTQVREEEIKNIYPLYFEEMIKQFGLTNLSALSKYAEEYRNIYLSNRFCAEDSMIEGAADFVKALSREGAHIVYISGRNIPNMNDCTVQALIKNGLPYGLQQNASLFLKPDPKMDDTLFKQSVMKEVVKLGKVVAGFENEPANINLFKDHFPYAEMVFIDTVHSKRTDVPYKNIPWIKNYKPNPVRFVADNRYYDVAMELIRGATQSIDMVQFEFFSESGKILYIAKSLIDKKEQYPDIKIRILLEGDKEKIGNRNLLTKELLERHGIEVFLDSNVQSTHTKMILVDGIEFLVGSHNLSNNSLTNNSETSVAFRSAELGSSVRYNYLNPLFNDPSRNHKFKDKHRMLEILTDAEYFDSALSMIQNAKKSIYLSMYYLAYRDESDINIIRLMDAIVDAKNRGVEVFIILEQSDQYAPHISEANRRAAEYLMQKGITNLRFDNLQKLMHSKFLVIDNEEILMGSTNWYEKDLFENHQVNVKLSQYETAQQLIRYFKNIE